MPKVYLVGGSGYIGAHLSKALVAQGHRVSSMSRSEASDATLRALGVEPIRGAIADIEGLRQAAAGSDAVIFAARYAPEEGEALAAVIEVFEGTDKPLVLTSGASMIAEETGGEASPRRFPEASVANPPKAAAIRLPSEELVRAAAGRGVRGMVIRPPLVFGEGANSKVKLMMDCAAKTGVVRYVGSGGNLWGVIHVGELADMFVRALERGRAGAVYHTVAGEVSMGDLARAVGRSIDRPAASWTLVEAEEGYGKFNARVGLGSSCRPDGRLTEVELGLTPTRNDLLAEVASGAYAADWRPVDPASAA